jgi:glycosyltransferase involved in cell wall biosynthesis
MPLSDHVFVQSEQMKRDIEREGISGAKMTAVPMGVSLPAMERYRGEQAAYPLGGRAIVYLGTLQRSRKMDFMIRVLSLVLRDVPQARLYLVGDGDGPGDRRFLDEYADRLGVGASLTITGFLPQTEALRYVKAAEVCVSPFFPTPVLNSTSPTKLIEYMAMRKAVVANDHPEQRQVLEDSGGGICVPYEEDAFANAIVTLLRDPARAEEMGRLGRRYVEEFRDYARIADMLEDKYYELLGSPRAARL